MPAALATLGAVAVIGVLASPAAAAPAAPPCPDAVIANVQILPSAVGCWNAIAVQAVRLDTAYPPQGLLYMGYVQGAVYDALTKIQGRYDPYERFDVPRGVDVRRALPAAATAAAAYTMLTSAFLGLPPAAQAGLSTKYSDYIAALGGGQAPAVAAGIAVGQAAANGLIAIRAGDRDESITFSPGPFTPGGWTFPPPPSLQSAQTPWLAVMRPFMLRSPAQFRAEPPPALSSRRWAREFDEVKAYGSVGSSVRSPEQTEIARFWNANAVNQSNQGFQDAARAHGLDSLAAARLLAMGDLIDSDALIACWDSKFHYLFWRPATAIPNAAVDGNPATRPDSAWAPLLTTPNHSEYPAAHTCLSGAEADIYSFVFHTRRINITLYGSADGTPNNWTVARTFVHAGELRREVANARVWGGLHYRGSTTAGLGLADEVAHWALRRFFQPTRAKEGE
jgi:PAP2 superfamily